MDTSDAEELEEIASSKPDYWLRFTLPRDVVQRHESKRLPLGIRKSESPPRKRRKVFNLVHVAHKLAHVSSA